MSKYLDYNWLRQKYEVEILTAKEIGKICNRSEYTITYHLRKAGIPARHAKYARRKYKNYDWIKEQYVDNKKTLKEIAQECNVSFSVIAYNLEKFNIPRRKPQSRVKGDKKYCETCDQYLLLSNFHKKKNSVDGLWHYCNKCYQERYHKTRKQYRQQPVVKEKMIQTSRLWAINNPLRYKEIIKKARQKKLSTIGGRIENTMRSSVCKSLKGMKQGHHWESLIGYTVQDLKNHLESQFESWMNWNNWGQASTKKKTWQIDHIKPISAFDITARDCDEFKQCWALSNLQPLDAIQNILKGSKIWV